MRRLHFDEAEAKAASAQQKQPQQQQERTMAAKGVSGCDDDNSSKKVASIYIESFIASAMEKYRR
jgi:hypothetical protein